MMTLTFVSKGILNIYLFLHTPWGFFKSAYLRISHGKEQAWEFCSMNFSALPTSHVHVVLLIGTSIASIWWMQTKHKAWWTPFDIAFHEQGMQLALLRERPVRSWFGLAFLFWTLITLACSYFLGNTFLNPNDLVLPGFLLL
jgi:hypothetical protein